MNGLRIIGQVLLWAGFISAALAASSQREFDLLPESEKAVLDKIPDDLEISRDQFASVTPKDLDEFTFEEFSAVVDALIPIAKENGAESESETESESEQESKAKPVSAADLRKSRVTRIEDKWPTVPWLWYCLSMAVGLVGVVLLRSTAKTAEQEHGRVAEEYLIVKSSLEKLNQRVSSLCKEMDKMAPKEVVHYIDDNLAEPFADFADARNALIQRFGLQPYAEIMTQFASGERFVNRTWSASADGYMNEAKDSLKRANAHLEEAAKLIAQYESENSHPQDA